MSELSLVKRFKQLASDYDNRPVVVRRGTVKSIMRFVQHEEWEVRHTAAETILLLAQHPDNKEPLCREPGFLDAVFEAYKSSEHADPKLHEVYSELFEELRSVLATTEDGDDGASSAVGPARDDGSIRTVKNRPTRVKQGATISRSLVLNVANLTAANQDELEELLQTIRGVVSYAIEPETRSVRVFGSTQTAALVAVLADGGFEVSVANDEEVERDENADGKPARPQPTYQSSFASKLNIFGDFDWRRTLVLHGIEGNSLQARLQKQKDERARKHQKDTSTMASMLNKLKSWW